MEHTRRRLVPALLNAGIKPGTPIHLQFPLRSGYLLHELPEKSFEDTLRQAGFPTSSGVIGITGASIYAEPEGGEELPVVIDTSAGRAQTLRTIAEWYRERGRDCLVTALSTTHQAIEQLLEANVRFLPVHAVVVDESAYGTSGPRTRLFLDTDDSLVRIGDLGDTFFRTDNPDVLLKRFSLLRPLQRKGVADHFHSVASCPQKACTIPSVC